jgi:hypothetical protein
MVWQVNGYALGSEAIGFEPENTVVMAGAAEMQIDWALFLFAGTHEYISRPTDPFPSQSFIGTLEHAFRIDRSIIGGDRIGEEITIGLGEITLTNSEGDYDDMESRHSASGGTAVIKMGDRFQPYSTWITVMTGFLTGTNVGRDAITFGIRDRGYILDIPASPNLYGGTGGMDGTDDLTGKSKPKFFGSVLNVTPPLLAPDFLVFQLNDGPIRSVENVYVRGAALVFAGDYSNLDDLSLAALTIGQYATALNAGLMRIAVATDAELGQVTADFTGDRASGIAPDTAADIVHALLLFGGAELTDADLDLTSFAQCNLDQPAPTCFGIPFGSTMTVATAVAAVMKGVGGWCGSRRDGRFEVKIFEAPSGTPTAIYDKTNVSNLSLGSLPAEVQPPPWRVRVAYARNWTPKQTDLAGSVTDERRAFLAEEVRFATAENPAIKIDFPFGNELVEDQAYFVNEADALAEAQRKLALYGTIRSLYVIPLCEPFFIHELGQVISIAFDRFGLDAGALARIVKLTEDSEEGVEITAFA